MPNDKLENLVRWRCRVLALQFTLEFTLNRDVVNQFISNSIKPWTYGAV